MTSARELPGPEPTRPQAGPHAMEDMDTRREYRGRTLVYSDRYGPREFWRGGQRVKCLCDPARGEQCGYHARGPEPALPEQAGQQADKEAGS